MVGNQSKISREVFTVEECSQGEGNLILSRRRHRGAPGFGRSTELSGSNGSYGLMICGAVGIVVAAGMVVL